MNGQIGKAYLKTYIDRAKPYINEFVENEIKAAKNAEFSPMSLDLLSDYQQMLSLGKGIRGTLVDLAYKACGGTEYDKILKASIFIELFHSAILIHDDIMDRDSFRRGTQTIHAKYKQFRKTDGEHFGSALAICIGDSGLFYSWKVLMQSEFAPALKVKAGEIFAHYTGRLGLGQAMDMSITTSPNVSESEVLKVLLVKSAEYTAIMPMLIGATLAGESNGVKLHALTQYAQNFGWAFQIQDDILGLFAKEEELGKPVGSDLREGKNTLLMINLRKLGSPDDVAFQKEILGNPHISEEDVRRMQNILIESGTLEHVRSLANLYVTEGVKYIPQITTDSVLKGTLESLIVYMLERSK